MRKILKLFIYAVFVLCMCLCMSRFSDGFKTKIAQSQKENLTNAINKAVTNYYAINGVYPESIEKIAKDYGISYDENTYIVNYIIFAANIYPDITVVTIE